MLYVGAPKWEPAAPAVFAGAPAAPAVLAAHVRRVVARALAGPAVHEHPEQAVHLRKHGERVSVTREL